MNYYNVRDSRGRFVKESNKKCKCKQKCSKKENKIREFNSDDISDATLSCLSTSIVKLAEDVGLYDLVGDTAELAITISIPNKFLWKDELLINFI